MQLRCVNLPFHLDVEMNRSRWNADGFVIHQKEPLSPVALKVGGLWLTSCSSFGHIWTHITKSWLILPAPTIPHLVGLAMFLNLITCPGFFCVHTTIFTLPQLLSITVTFLFSGHLKDLERNLISVWLQIKVWEWVNVTCNTSCACLKFPEEW